MQLFKKDVNTIAERQRSRAQRDADVKRAVEPDGKRSGGLSGWLFGWIWGPPS